VTEFESVDYFTDPSVVPDPYPYFDYLRSKCPVAREPHQGVLAVTGHLEALAVYRDPAFDLVQTAACAGRSDLLSRRGPAYT
jgi:cytochrome P450